MKRSTSTPSATSLPRAPRDEVSARSVRYLVMMGVRVLCFILMVVVQPYGWYTWLFGAAAIFLPYIAVVLANVGQDAKPTGAENPERALPAAPETPAHPDDAASRVIRISEATPLDAQHSADNAPTQPAASAGDAGAATPDAEAPEGESAK